MPDAAPGIATQPDVQGRRWGTLPLVAPSVGVLLLWMVVPLARVRRNVSSSAVARLRMRS